MNAQLKTLMRRGYRYEHAHQGEQQRRVNRNAHDEHVMGPDKEAEYRNPLPTEKATAVYPKTRLRLKQRSLSDMIPMPGRIITYTAGCE